MKRRMLAGLMSVCLLVCVLVSARGFSVLAVSTGTVQVEDSLRVRSGAGTEYPVIGYLFNGNVVTIDEGASTGEWFKITYGSLSGYASREFITVNATYTTDTDFESYLTAQGFPESYKAGLRQLHASHPQWVFQAKAVNIAWNTVIENESVVGRNLTQSSGLAWRSMEYGAYDWNSRSYISFDSGGWYTATSAVVAYYMDPRNFLTNAGIFQFDVLSFSGNETVEGIRSILPASMSSYAQDLLNAARDSGVSAYFLAAKIVQEGTANNGLGLGTVSGYEGYYNLFDIGAYDHDGRSAVQNGALYAKNHGWNTPYKCMVESARSNFADSYFSMGQNTPYFQKFNVVNSKSGLYRHQYMTNVSGAYSEGKIMYDRLSAEARNCSHTFSIPVYLSMPDAPSPQPSSYGNNNNFLLSLYVGGYGITPTFDKYTYHYTVQVPSEVSWVEVAAQLGDTDAAYDNLGKLSLDHGSNVFPITISATSGQQRIYWLTVIREGTAGALPTVHSSVYTIDSTVTKVEPDTTVSAFLSRLAVTNGTAGLADASGNEKTAGAVATGDILRLYSGSVFTTAYPVVIYGDASGDGRVNSQDLRMAQKHILGVSNLSGYYLSAADSNRDGKLSSQDLRNTQKFILGVSASIQ